MSKSIQLFVLAVVFFVAFGFTKLVNAEGFGNPQPGSTQTGIGVISGFWCDADVLEFQVDDRPINLLAYPTPRGDTVGICGHEMTGFSALWNYNLFGQGNHTIKLFADGVLVQSVDFKVVCPCSSPFEVGLEGRVIWEDFPEEGKRVCIEWQESKQNVSIVGIGNMPGPGGPVLDLFCRKFIVPDLGPGPVLPGDLIPIDPLLPIDEILPLLPTIPGFPYY